MSSAKNIDDEWVADLLSKEAAECALKYSSIGMDAYTKPAKRPENHPKPNTRFLTNIVKATNSHNRNLLEQERADSQARLNHLDRIKQEAENREKRRRPGASDTRKRMLGDIKAIIGGSSKKRRADDDGDRTPEAESDAKRSRRDGDGIRIRSRGQARENEGDRDDLLGSSKGSNSRKELFADHGPKRALPREYRDKEGSRSDDRRHRHDREDRHGRHERHDKHGDRGSRRDDDKQRDRNSRGARSERRVEPSRLKERYSDESDSDPLEDIIGPKPPSEVRKRGRGTASGTLAMDSRFDSTYDPKTDVALNHDDEDDDWGSALEALRDRERWKQQGAERLRAAGFTEDQVKKWEKGDKKNEEDVQWTKKGEQREWDRGKTLSDGI